MMAVPHRISPHGITPEERKQTGAGRRLPVHETLRKATLELQTYIENEAYRGYDPYDCLASPLFSLPLLRKARMLRLAAQQTMKRLPVNVRPLFGISKGYNPVTLGLCLQAYVSLREVMKEKRETLDRQISFCLGELDRLMSRGYSGACWGYDFDWEARYARIPAFVPTIVATGFVTNALFRCYQRTGIVRARELCQSAADFVRKDLHRTYNGRLFCFSYSPLDAQVVLNATMKGARILAQASALSGDNRLLEDAALTVRFVMEQQRPNGSWPYAIGDTRTWVDNFHTGYVLDCLDDVMAIGGFEEFAPHRERGVQFYLSQFVHEGQIPKYYDNALYPVDATAAAQCILTHVRFGKVETAARIAAWMTEHMRDPSGYYYYQRHARSVNKISYMRWSNAWMFLALSTLLEHADGLV